MVELNKKEFTPDWYDEHMNNRRYHMHAENSKFYHVWRWALHNISRIEPIIELGCGTGQFAEIALKEGYNYKLGIDFSPKNIETAQMINEKYADRFVCENLDNFIVINPKMTFVSFEVIEHLEHDLELLDKLKNSKIIFTVPNFDATSHLRYFENVPELEKRYGKIINIDRDNIALFFHGVHTIYGVIANDGIFREDYITQ